MPQSLASTALVMRRHLLPLLVLPVGWASHDIVIPRNSVPAGAASGVLTGIVQSAHSYGGIF
jgi:hypothetical protein